jgi:RNA-binding protein NOB1
MEAGGLEETGAADEALVREVEKVSLNEESESSSPTADDAAPEAEPAHSEPSSEAGPSTSGGYPASYAPEDPTDELDDSHSEDDEETGGEWITPANVNRFKARDLGLALPETSAARGNNLQPKKPRAVMKSACMTSDFAVQNVLLQMGLNLVGGEGRRIRSVRSWVLRCHACFK